LFFAGQGVSLIGTWMQQLALSWLVFRQAPPGERAFLLGLVGFAGQAPAFVLVPFAGVLIDRWDRHRLLVVTQTLMLLQALALPPGADLIPLPLVIALSAATGCLNAFDMPTRQSFLPDMLTDKDDLGNAIALNSSLFHGARLVGPSLASLVIALTGEAVCF